MHIDSVAVSKENDKLKEENKILLKKVELLNNIAEGSCPSSISCPSDFGLVESCGERKCFECWIEALKDV